VRSAVPQDRTASRQPCSHRALPEASPWHNFSRYATADDVPFLAQICSERDAHAHPAKVVISQRRR